MGDFDQAFQSKLKYQSWSLYAVAFVFIVLRIYARWLRLGFRGFQTDDWAMLLAFGLYTSLVVCLNVISEGGGSNLYDPADFSSFTEKEIKDRIKGSKIVLVSEQSMLNVIYVCKACMLCIYSRLTLGLREEQAVRIVSYYVLAGWVGTQIAFFTTCRPFKDYWAVPFKDPQCTTFEHYAIIQGIFNLSSDTLMLLIPLPLVFRMRVSTKQKAILIIVFSMGIFVIIAAILTKVFNLSNVFDPSYMLWYDRESSVAIYVTNIPMIWPLMREWFPILNSYAGHATSAPYATKNAHSHPLTTFNAGRTTSRHMTKLDSGEESANELASITSNESQQPIKEVNIDGIQKNTSVLVTEEKNAAFQNASDAEKGNVYDWQNEGGNKYTVEATGMAESSANAGGNGSSLGFTLFPHNGTK